MPQATTQFVVIDGLGASRTFQAEQDIQSGSLTPHHVLEVADAPVSPANPLPVVFSDGVLIAQSVVTLSPGFDVQLVGINPARRSLVVMNIDVGAATLGFGGPAQFGNGLPLDPAGNSGGTGGAMTWHAVPPTGSVHAISATGTRIVVLEGV